MKTKQSNTNHFKKILDALNINWMTIFRMLQGKHKLNKAY